MTKRLQRALLEGTVCVGLILTAIPAHAQEETHAQVEAEETSQLDRIGRWKLINSAIFAVLVGWFIAKKAPVFFQTRSSDIAKAIQDATGLKMEADYRYSEVDRKMANLAGEVKKLRDEGDVEMKREHERMERDTATETERIRHNAANEVEALRKEASDRVQARAAQLALEQAERLLQARFTQGEPADSIHDFVRLVEQSKN